MLTFCQYDLTNEWLIDLCYIFKSEILAWDISAVLVKQQSQQCESVKILCILKYLPEYDPSVHMV